jgi:putative ABC transport system ATP-binding protein
MGATLALRNLTLAFRGAAAPVLDIDAWDVAAGGSVGITGASGAGKTTLLHALAGIVVPDSGSVCWDEGDVATMASGARDAWRRRHVGLVFQDFHLFPGLSALGNVLLPMRFDHWGIDADTRGRALSLLQAAGLPAPDQPVTTLSRGERQRVAIARALLRRPAVVLADEPTASLDTDSARSSVDLLLAETQAAGATLLVVSHDAGVLARCDTRWRLADGRLVVLP